MAKEKSSVTMKEVAQEAGVALGTVSKVINGLPVGEEYRLRVEKAIKKLNYRVNSYAKGLRSDKTYLVEVIVPNVIHPFYSKLVNHINLELMRRNYKMLLCVTDFDPEREQAFAFMAEQQMVDGIICLCYNPKLQLPQNIPMISIDRSFGIDIPCVASDNFTGGVLAAQKLAENGCKHMAFMHIGSKLTNEPIKRKDGFVSVCESLGIPYSLKLLNDGAPYAEFEDFLLREHFHDGKLDFDGLFCGTDYLACQVRQTLANVGLRVPEDVQIIGFDGMRYFGDMELYCSTIVQPVERIAHACVTLLLEKHLENMPYMMYLPVSYAYGGTTKA